METKLNKLIEEAILKLNGKITQDQFKNIIKKMNWKMNYKKIHVVGTNGKGSVSKHLNDNLISNKIRTGLFTSPHLFSLEERIKFNNKNIPFINLQQNIINLHLNFPQYKFGFFELVFFACIDYFENKEVDVVIFEAGIGAKEDIVNYLDFDITIFTSISIDHEKILGASMIEIATDKSYAIKHNNKVFYPNTIGENNIKILEARAFEMNNKNLNLLKINTKNIVEQNQELAKLILKEEFKITETSFSQPIGRAQKININAVECYIDVGHNFDGIKKTLKYFKTQNIEFDNFVISLSSDKNVQKIMTNFDPKNTFVYQNKSERSLKISEYPIEFQKINSLNDFVNKINKKILFIGSFYFIEELLRMIKYEV